MCVCRRYRQRHCQHQQYQQQNPSGEGLPAFVVRAGERDVRVSAEVAFCQMRHQGSVWSGESRCTNIDGKTPLRAVYTTDVPVAERVSHSNSPSHHPSSMVARERGSTIVVVVFAGTGARPSTRITEPGEKDNSSTFVPTNRSLVRTKVPGSGCSLSDPSTAAMAKEILKIENDQTVGC